MKKRIVTAITTVVVILCSISMPVKGEAVVLQNSSAALYTQQAEVTDLTVAEAIEKAKKRNNALITTAESRTAIEEDINRAGLITESAVLLEGYSTTNDTLYNNLISSARNQMNLAANAYSKKQQEDLIELSVNNYFGAIINAQKDLSLSAKALEIEKRELEIEKTKLKLGLISKSSLNTKEAAINKSVKNLDDTAKAVETAFEDLNYYMDENTSNRYNLKMDIEFVPLGDIDLDYYVALGISSSPEILQKENDVQLAEFDLKLSTDSSSSWTTRNNKLNQASRSLAEAKKSLEEKIRKSYSSIINLEGQIEQNLLDEENIQNDIKIKEVQLSNGLIAPLELDKAKHQLEENLQQREKLIVNHYLEKLSFEKPY